MGKQQELENIIESLLEALHERHGPSADHCRRTAILSVELGKACSLSDIELTHLRLAARIHDVGKIGIPDDVLLKPGGLNANEWAIIKTHANSGFRILSSAPIEELEILAHAARHHHESFDGSGYPDGLQGEQIPLYSRMIALADRYDAMTSPRSYREAMTHADAMHLIQDENAAHFDPYLRNRFVKLFETGNLNPNHIK